MKKEHIYISFFTASILHWKKLLSPDKYKNLILDSLKFLVKDERVKVYGYVIMPNHIHLLWKINKKYTLEKVQRSFLRFTAQHIKYDLFDHHPDVLSQFYVGMRDREYQFWQQKPLSVYLNSREVVEQKLDYIHNNPVQGKWRLSEGPDSYPFSSWDFYYHEKDSRKFLTHYMEEFS